MIAPAGASIAAVCLRPRLPLDCEFAAYRAISDILWHARQGMTPHYSQAQVREIQAALELIADEKNAWNKTLSSIARDAVGTEVPIQRKSG